jgi:hypothetical protein
MVSAYVVSGWALLSLTHLAPQILPAQYQALYGHVKPSLQWVISGTAIATGSPYIFFLASVPHAAVATLALISVGLRNSLCQQVLYGPAIASLVAWSLSKLLPSISASSAWTFVLLQLINVILGIVVTMLYPAPIVKSLMDVGTARKAMMRDPQGFVFARIPVRDAPNHLTLDAVIIPPSQHREQPKFSRRKFLLYLGGNGELFEGTYMSLAALADRLGVTVVMANPMGVGQSDGATKNVDDLVLAARSTAEWILAGGVQECMGGVPDRHGGATSVVSRRDIVAFGHSIGGGVASRLVAEYFPEFGLVLDRTFSSLSDAAISLSPVTKSPHLVRAVLKLSNFGDMDNVDNFRRVPHNRKLITFHRKDQIIKFSESSIARLPQFQRNNAESPNSESDDASVVASPSLSAYVLEVHSRKFTPDAHNVGITDLDGMDEVTRRILTFYERSLSG